MKHLFFTAVLALGTTQGLVGPALAGPPPVAAPAGTISSAGTTSAAEDAPRYGGVYINGKQVTEISCYGVDELTIVYPFFAPLDMCDHFSVVTRAGVFDTKGKFVLEYSDYKMYDAGDVDAVRAKFAGKGYGTITRTGLLENFNAHRTARVQEGYEASENNPMFNVLKYTDFDANKFTKSVMYIEVYTFNYSGRYNDYGDPIFTSTKIYRSPDILLKDRVSTGAAGLKESGAKKGLSFVPIVGAVTLAMKGKPLPEMTNENCVPVGKDVALSTVKKVGRSDIGEELDTD